MNNKPGTKLMVGAYGAAAALHEVGRIVYNAPFFLLGASALTLSCAKEICRLVRQASQ